MSKVFCIILLLTVAQGLCSKSIKKTEEETDELNLIEKILLFPYCMSDCSDLLKPPLEGFENTDDIPTHERERTTDAYFEFDKPTDDHAGTIDEVEPVRSNLKSIFDSEDPLTDGFAYVVEMVMDWISIGWDFINDFLGKVYQQIAFAVHYIYDVTAGCANYDKTWAGLQEAAVTAWRKIQDELVVATEKVTETLSFVPCEEPPENLSIWSCIREKMGSFFDSATGYILATLFILTSVLAIQFIRKKALSRSRLLQQNLPGSSRVKRDERPNMFKKSPRIENLPKPITRSPKKPIKTKNGVGAQRRTKTELESHQQHRVPTLSPSNRPPSSRSISPRPLPRLIDAGSGSMFASPMFSDVNEATDTDDLNIILKRKTPSPYGPGGSPMPSNPVWIRYGSSPVKRHLDTKYARTGRAASPIWERRVSTDGNWVGSYLRTVRSPMCSPGKLRYVPSPIYIEERPNMSIDVDIGEPCYSSSFIEECLSESGGRSRRDSGDISLNSQCLRPSVITKRYTKLQTGDFSMSNANSSADTSMTLDVSELNKSISLYTGDGMVFLELAFVYAFQNIFNRVRDLVRWSRWARTRRTHLQTS